jgi:hypothetical protein
MKKVDLLKTFGGISVMLSVFLLLAVTLNYKLVVEGAKYAVENNDDLRQTSIVQSGRAFPPRDIVEGFFDADREGDIKESEKQNGKEVVHHYRAIHVDEIKSTDKQPVLKLQVYNDNKKSWKVTEISRLDKEDGTVYFLLKSQEDEDVVPNDFYTGTYQLIFE